MSIFRIIGGIIVFLVGVGVFVCIGDQILEQLLGVARRTALLISIPSGVATFAIFIWANWDNDLEGWHKRTLTDVPRTEECEDDKIKGGNDN
jgi:hypothetical protein